MKRLIVATVLCLGAGLSKASCSLPEKRVEKEIRFFQLLPEMPQLPLVKPELPKGFVLAIQDIDHAEYFWGKKETLEQYFERPSSLNGCLIQAQITTDTKQISFDRFSLDGEIYKELQGEGFTGISLRKGKWGIFPYRHLKAKNPKGREEYTLWVGLNSEGGKTICFTLVYPYYLSEPSESQRKVWKDFVEKTALLSLAELASKKGAKAGFTTGLELPGGNISLRVEKRKADQKFLVLIEGGKEKVEVKGLKDLSLSVANFLKRPSYLVEVTLAFKEHPEKNRTVFVPFHLVPSFSYEVGMLNPDRLEEADGVLVFELKNSSNH